MITLLKITMMTMIFFVVANSSLLLEITQPLRESADRSVCLVPDDVRAEYPDLCK